MRASQADQGWSGTIARRGRTIGRWGLGVRRSRAGLGRLLRVLLVLAPTLLAAAYYGLIATDRYVSEARFVIRTAAKPASTIGGLNALLQLAGMSRSEDDAYAVRDFLTSRDALRRLRERLNLERIYGPPDADFVARWPSIFYGPSDEMLHLYFQRMLSVVVNSSSGLTTLRAQAFRAEDAQEVATELLAFGEDLVNRLNVRLQDDAVRVAAAEVTQAEERRIANQIAITAFRNRELILDPGRNSAIVVELIGRLSGELADLRAQIGEMQGNAPNSPQMNGLAHRAAAIERQIALERARVGNGSDGLADKIAEYERLMLEREFSVRSLSQAVSALEAARVEARRQQLFLERVVEPGRPDEATMPQRWRTALTVFGFNVIGFGVLWLIWSGLREHAGEKGH
jgi:capsular polysaccharide transport system permease protein